MRKRRVFRILVFGAVVSVCGWMFFAQGLEKFVPVSVLPAAAPTLSPGMVDLDANKANNCPSVLSQSASTHFYADIIRNRSKHGINYYEARHNRPGEIQDTVVILTPISNSVEDLPRYFRNLCSLDYPHDKISVVLGEDSSRDGSTFKIAQDAVKLVEPYFHRVEAVQLHEEWSRPPVSKHEQTIQVDRRKHMARSRNKLLHIGLRDEKWALWMDVDLAYIPPDLIQQMISVQKHIVVPGCIFVNNDKTVDVYDKNTWQETNRSIEFQQDQSKKFVMLEGYNGESMRRYLPSFRKDGNMYIKLDGVGGAALLVYAECHKRGLIFPPFVYEHHIETEGFAKIAKDMGYEVIGLPYLEVIHG